MSIGEANFVGLISCQMHYITTLRAITLDKITSFIFYREPNKVNTIITFRMKAALNTQNIQKYVYRLNALNHYDRRSTSAASRLLLET